MIYTKRKENTKRTMKTRKDLERTRRRTEGIKGGMKEGTKEGQDKHRKDKKA